MNSNVGMTKLSAPDRTENIIFMVILLDGLKEYHASIWSEPWIANHDYYSKQGGGFGSIPVFIKRLDPGPGFQNEVGSGSCLIIRI